MIDLAASRRVLIGATATLSHQWADADGEPAAPSGTVTVGIVNAAGTTVVASGTATSGTSSNPRTYTLAAQLVPARLTVTWTDDGNAAAVDDVVEIVGGYYFTVAEFLTWAGPAGAAWNADQVIAARRIVEDSCEELTDACWVPRYRRERVSGTGTATLVLPAPFLREVLSVREYDDATTYTAWTAGELAAISGDGIHRRAGLAVLTDGGTWTAGTDNYVVEYLCGAAAPPTDLKQAAMKHCRAVLHDASAPVMATAERWTVADLVVTRAIPTATRLGLPDIDGVYERYSRRTPGIA